MAPGRRNHVRMTGHAEVAKSAVVRRDDEDLGGDPLQNLDLPDDDGAPVDDEPALVPPPNRRAWPPARIAAAIVAHRRTRRIMTEGA